MDRVWTIQSALSFFNYKICRCKIRLCESITDIKQVVCFSEFKAADLSNLRRFYKNITQALIERRISVNGHKQTSFKNNPQIFNINDRANVVAVRPDEKIAFV